MSNQIRATASAGTGRHKRSTAARPADKNDVGQRSCHAKGLLSSPDGERLTARPLALGVYRIENRPKRFGRHVSSPSTIGRTRRCLDGAALRRATLLA